jgi:DNA-directed RNA polymerase subunit K
MAEEQLTRFERARIIGARALQIARGAPILIKTEETNTIRIAEAEFAAGVIPLTVRHKLPPKQ